jgi:hypothetical protein
MRHREVIEDEIDRARDDLQRSLGELRYLVQDRLDVRARARRALERSPWTLAELVAGALVVGALAGWLTSRRSSAWSRRRRGWC